MCFTECEPCEVWNESLRQARKPHRCDSCFGTIEPREVYQYVSGIFDKRPFSFDICAVCWRLHDKVVEWELGEGCGWFEAQPAVEEIFISAVEREIPIASKELSQCLMRAVIRLRKQPELANAH